MVSEAPGGAGYGDPLDRDPELVKLRVREGWLSLEKAKDVYGVILDTSNEQYAVDYGRTTKLRAKLKKKQTTKPRKRAQLKKQQTAKPLKND